MKFTESHEWISIEADLAVVGITRYAQQELGEIVHLELPKVDTKVTAGDEVAVLESTKAAADIYSPASGVITEVNARLAEDLTLINESPETNGWLYKMKLDDARELESLYDQDKYNELVTQ
ncbi:MAG: Glycine cleavage system H protein [Chlamydiia bacterium]|nr:Glycine cleavage system H protein [Chlamydiia bacterium]